MKQDSEDRSRWLPPESELSEKFILTGGPGGQHVNRTESAVQLRFDVVQSSFLNDAVRARLIQLAGRRLGSDGVLMIEGRSHRSQHRNREDVRQRLAELIKRAHHQPRKRIPTRPGKAAKQKRIDAKRQRSGIKAARRKPDGTD